MAQRKRLACEYPSALPVADREFGSGWNELALDVPRACRRKSRPYGTLPK
jgi:hypothetical protein